MKTFSFGLINSYGLSRFREWERDDARRKINNLRYADHATLMTENEVELKSLLMKVKKLA